MYDPSGYGWWPQVPPVSMAPHPSVTMATYAAGLGYMPPEELIDEEDFEHDETGKRKQSEKLPVNGNGDTMNLQQILLVNIQSSEYFKSLYELKTYHEVLDEIYNSVSHMEPYASGQNPSPAFCLMYKLFRMRLSHKQMTGMLNHKDSPYIRALGLLYLRLTLPPRQMWPWFSPYFDDEEEFCLALGQKRPTTIGKFSQRLLMEQKHFSVLLPRIPVPLMREIKENFKEQQGYEFEPEDSVPKKGSREKYDEEENYESKESNNFNNRNREKDREDDKYPRDKRRRDDRDKEDRPRDRERRDDRDRDREHKNRDREYRDRGDRGDRDRGDRDRGDRDRGDRGDRRDRDREYRDRDRGDRGDRDRGDRDRGDRDRDRGDRGDRDRDSHRDRDRGRDRDHRDKRDRAKSKSSSPKPTPKKPRVDKQLLKEMYGTGEEDTNNEQQQYTQNMGAAETIRLGFRK